MIRLLIGFIIAPLTAAAVAVLGILWAESVPALARHLPPVVFPEDLPFLGAWALLFASAVTAFGAIPLVLWQRSRGAVSFRIHLLAGALLGASPFLLLGFGAICFAVVEADWQRIPDSITTITPFALVGSVAGIVSASVFYLTAGASSSSRPGAA